MEAEQTLAEVRRLRDRAHARAHGGAWLPAAAIAALLLASVAERSRGLVAAGLWIGLMAMWLCQWSPLGALPGGTLSLRPGHYVIVMALPLMVFAAVRYARGRTARD